MLSPRSRAATFNKNNNEIDMLSFKDIDITWRLTVTFCNGNVNQCTDIMLCACGKLLTLFHAFKTRTSTIFRKEAGCIQLAWSLLSDHRRHILHIQQPKKLLKTVMTLRHLHVKAGSGTSAYRIKHDKTKPNPRKLDEFLMQWILWIMFCFGKGTTQERIGFFFNCMASNL